MGLDLDKALVIGTMSATVNEIGQHTFTRWADTHSKSGFIQVAQYLIDGIPDISRFIILDVENCKVYSFSHVVKDILNLQSKRYKGG